MLNTLGPTLFSEYFAFMSTYQPQANAWLSSTAIAAASTQSTWRPTWAYADQGLDATTYKGNCLNGYGCSIALTWTANNGTGGLQYVDAGLPLGVLCKAFLAPLTSNTTGNNTFYPLPSGNNTQPSNYTTGNNTFYSPPNSNITQPTNYTNGNNTFYLPTPSGAADATTLIAAKSVIDYSSGFTVFAIFGASTNGTNVSASNNETNVTALDNRQIYEGAVQACIAQGGSLAFLTDANLPLLSYLFTSYYTDAAPLGWGIRKTCAWVANTNLGLFGGMGNFSGTYTSELFWAEDAGSTCGAVSPSFDAGA